MTLQDIINTAATRFNYSEEDRECQLCVTLDVFSRVKLEDIINALHKTKVVRDEDLGICYNLSHNLECSHAPTDGYMIVRLLSAGWEYHSGYESYPILDDDTGEVSAYHNLWTGCRLTSRLDLIDYMIDKLKMLKI